MNSLDKVQKIIEANQIVKRWKEELGVVCFDSAILVDEIHLDVEAFLSIFTTYSVKEKKGYYYLTVCYGGVTFLALATIQEVKDYDVQI